MARKILWAAVALATLPASARAQEAELRPPDPAAVEAALADIRRADDLKAPYSKASGVLTQRVGARARAELDAFAEQLVEIVLADGVVIPMTSRAHAAYHALVMSGTADGSREIVYEGAFDAVHRIWDARVRTVPAEERLASHLLHGTLEDLYRIEPEGRGRELMHAQIAAADAEIPRLPAVKDKRSPLDTSSFVNSPWCLLVRFVYGYHRDRYEDSYRELELSVEDEEAHEWAMRRLEGELPGTSMPLTEICGVTAQGGIRIVS